jgi:hypothetical protein
MRLPDRVVMFYAREDAEAKQVVAQLIEDCGFTAVDMGGWDTLRFMEAPGPADSSPPGAPVARQLRWLVFGCSHSSRGARSLCVSARISWWRMSSVLIHRCWPRVRPTKKPSSTSSGSVK